MSGLEPNVLSVGYMIPGYLEQFIPFYSNQSLTDADLVIFCPSISPPTAESASRTIFKRGGKSDYDEHISYALKRQLDHWRKELSDFVATGKNVVILLDHFETFYLTLRQQENRTSYEASNYDAIPVVIPGLTSGSGNDIKNGRDFNNVYSLTENLKPYANYRLYFNDCELARIIYTSKDRSRVIGGVKNTEYGSYILMPYFVNDHEDFFEEDPFGGPEYSLLGYLFGQDLLDFFARIDKHLRVDGHKTPPPDWSANPSRRFKQEAALSQKVDSITTSIKELERQRKLLLAESAALASFRGLLYETGKPLENCVTRALDTLGFTVENYDDGTLEIDQIIVSPENERYLGECEGKDSKPVSIEKLRQLYSSIGEYNLKDEDEGCINGILFGNPARLLEPGRRQEWFTRRCLDAAKQHNIALVRTPDLFPIIKYLMEHDDEAFARSCREAIHRGLGGIVEFPAIPIAVSEVPLNAPTD